MFVGILSVTDEKAVSGSIAGSVSHWYGSADPDPDLYQNVPDPQHCSEDYAIMIAFCVVEKLRDPLSLIYGAQPVVLYR